MQSVIRRPLITEKNSLMAETGVYVFEVDQKANKTDIKKAIEKSFRVKVKSVRTSICRGRARRTRLGVGRVARWKKAMVRLNAGEKIALFEGA
ncbi:MAG: 50S ribosomal protein L23 [Bdellovibrionales bacterium]